MDLKHRRIFNENLTSAVQNWELSSADPGSRVKTVLIPGHVSVPPCLPLCLSRKSMPCSACEQAGRHAAAQLHEDSNCHGEDWFRQRDDHLQRKREAKRAKRRGDNSKTAQLKPAEPKREPSQQMGPQPAPTTSAETKPAQPAEERLVCAMAVLRERATENVERLTWSVIEDNVARWLRKNPGKDLKTWWELQRCAVAHRQ